MPLAWRGVYNPGSASTPHGTCTFCAVCGLLRASARFISAAARLYARGRLLAWEMDGQPLSVPHGAPLRVVAPTRYFYKSVKWVREIRLLPHDVLGYWERGGYHNNADFWREERYVAGNLTARQVERLRHTADFHPYVGQVLLSLDLRATDFRGANLRQVQLKHCHLVGCNLQGADLRQANLTNSDLQGANLQWSRSERRRPRGGVAYGGGFTPLLNAAGASGGGGILASRAAAGASRGARSAWGIHRRPTRRPTTIFTPAGCFANRLENR